MNSGVSVGWMKLGLRAQICGQCRPAATTQDVMPVIAPFGCESKCALFVQLPRLARFLERYRGKPPAGYEEFALKLLSDYSADPSECSQSPHPQAVPGPFLNYSSDAFAILERIAQLSGAPPAQIPAHDCTRRSLAMGQLSVQASKSTD